MIVYQEQVMQIAHGIAGFSFGRADIMRKAMGKKDPKAMAAQRADFVAGARERGVPEAKARRLFDLVAYFAGYGFNKSHTAAYALLAYHTAYLKAHYAAAFLAATLSSEMEDSDRIAVLVEEVRRLGIRLLGPCVNASRARFDLEDGAIRFGLCAVRNVGRNAIAAIEEARDAGGPFTDLFDFTSRVDVRTLNRRMIESLIQAGAFDALEIDRARLFAAVPQALDWGERRRRDTAAGQESLFGSGTSTPLARPTPPEAQAWTLSERAGHEKAVLGFYFSGHPLDGVREDLRRLASGTLGHLRLQPDGFACRAVGVVTAIKKVQTRKGELMAFVALEDTTATMEALVFPELFTRRGGSLVADAIVWLEARISCRDGEEPKLVAEDLRPWQEARVRSLGLFLSLPSPELSLALQQDLERVLEGSTGPVPVYVEVPEADGTMVLLRSGRYRVAFDEMLTSNCEALLGPGRARYGPRL